MGNNRLQGSPEILPYSRDLAIQLMFTPFRVRNVPYLGLGQLSNVNTHLLIK